MSHDLEFSPAVQAILGKLPKTVNDDGTAPMLPGECYTSAEFFDFERTQVFTRSWMCVGHEQQIPKPGDYLAPNVAGEPLLAEVRIPPPGGGLRFGPQGPPWGRGPGFLGGPGGRGPGPRPK